MFITVEIIEKGCFDSLQPWNSAQIVYLNLGGRVVILLEKIGDSGNNALYQANLFVQVQHSLTADPAFGGRSL
ncbi:hypothetical protein MGG_17364 [Pyricularia oryzae 70-15]|uniref:Uncharacterized protein n=1 Tax=Pyricularia oryzae (strain 70-15 / ATCC MYA-4617 / FGSC 8958) TaxID=242507 RepID=G4NEB9_PYRO7|nr:uncharacterized protein MGG_17364 [Pyricularia oryzae 70-15]EHA48602.1 hypothetical protein MGG_17364 [Pyricularia oryzae 70-15]